jgi:hypothetical protein
VLAPDVLGGDGTVLGADFHADVAFGDDVVRDHEVAPAVDVDAGGDER